MRTLSPPWRRVLVGSWVVILTLSVGFIILYTDNKRIRDCIADYMVQDQQATLIRSEAASAERQQFKETLRTVTTDPDQADRLKSINDYIALLDKNDQVRRENPIRPVPTECS